LGGSCLAQVIGQLGDIPPDVDNPELLEAFFRAITAMRKESLLLAYHDRSDGGLLTAICEMSFAGRVGVSLEIKNLGGDELPILFSEELGAVIQYSLKEKERVQAILRQENLLSCSTAIGSLNHENVITLSRDGVIVYSEPRVFLQRLWSLT